VEETASHRQETVVARRSSQSRSACVELGEERSRCGRIAQHRPIGLESREPTVQTEQAGDRQTRDAAVSVRGTRQQQSNERFELRRY
jgi:hypothetical protein